MEIEDSLPCLASPFRNRTILLGLKVRDIAVDLIRRLCHLSDTENSSVLTRTIWLHFNHNFVLNQSLLSHIMVLVLSFVWDQSCCNPGSELV